MYVPSLAGLWAMRAQPAWLVAWLAVIDAAAQSRLEANAPVLNTFGADHQEKRGRSPRRRSLAGGAAGSRRTPAVFYAV